MRTWGTWDKVLFAGAMVPHFVSEALIGHEMYCNTPAGIGVSHVPERTFYSTIFP